MLIRDLEMLLNTIKKDDTKEYMKEALNCYHAGSYRACVVLSVVAGMHDLYNKVQALASSIKQVKQLADKIEKMRNGLDNYERYMIEQCKTDKIGILTADEAKLLGIYMDIRNQCAHPGEHISSAEEARMVFVGIIDILASKPVLLGANYKGILVKELGSSIFFPYESQEIYEQVVKEKVEPFHEKAILPIAKEILKVIKDNQSDAITRKNGSIFLANMNKFCNLNVEYIFNDILQDDMYLSLVFQLIEYNYDIVNRLNDINRKKVIADIKKCSKNRTGIVVDELIIKMLSVISSLTMEERKQLIDTMINSDNGVLYKKLYIGIEEKIFSEQENSYILEELNVLIDNKSKNNDYIEQEAIEQLIEIFNNDSLIEKYGEYIEKLIATGDFYIINRGVETLNKVSIAIRSRFSDELCVNITNELITGSYINAFEARSVVRGGNRNNDDILKRYCNYLQSSNEKASKILKKHWHYDEWIIMMKNIDATNSLQQILWNICNNKWKFEKLLLRQLVSSMRKEGLGETIESMLDDIETNIEQYTL